MAVNPKQTPLIIAHRGCRDRYPENTLEAFQAAVDAKADMIELDVALTKDRQLIIIHDDTLDRTTNGSGLVKDYTLAELKGLDAGSWFSQTFAGVRLPELKEVFKKFGNKIPINIEIKASYYEKAPDFPSIEHLVLELVTQFGLTDAVLISSFDIRSIKRLFELGAQSRIAFISDEALEKDEIQTLTAIGAFSWHPWHLKITNRHIQQARDAGFKVFPFTVNTVEEFQNLKAMGVNGVFTDHVQLMQSAR